MTRIIDIIVVSITTLIMITRLKVVAASGLSLRQHEHVGILEVGHGLAPLEKLDVEEARGELHVPQGPRLAQLALCGRAARVEALDEDVPHHLGSGWQGGTVGPWG